MKKYIKNGEVRTRNRITCKVVEQEEIDGVLQDVEYVVYNPSEEQILSEGWEEYDDIAERYKDRVIERIREKYSVDDEIAILRQRDSKVEEFEEYNEYVEDCKAKAREDVFK